MPARRPTRQRPALRTPLLLSALIGGMLGCMETARRQPEPSVDQARISAAMQQAVQRHEVAGAVTLVVDPDRILHLSAVGDSDLAAATPMHSDALFWIASMTKPITASVVMMLQEEGKLSVDEPVAKYIPEFADVKTPDGRPGNLTLRHLLTHTSGLSEVSADEGRNAHSLAELIPLFAHKPLQFVPGSKWQYCQTGLNTLGRIIEVVSGHSLPDELRDRLFAPLGMVDTTFYPTPEQLQRLAKSYQVSNGQLSLHPLPLPFDPAIPNRVPLANGGLFSTARDYGRFCQMILHQGMLDGHRYLTPSSVAQMTQVQTGDLATGFTPGNGWGFGWCVIRQPQGVSAALSPGSFGHGGAYGTQAWIDPVAKRAYVLLVQRSNFPNSDGSDIRRDFQDAAVAALAHPAAH